MLHILAIIERFGQLVISFKSLRAGALATLKDISSVLIKRSGLDGSNEARTAFVESCPPALMGQVNMCDLSN